IVWKIRAWYPRAGTSLSAQVTRRIPVAHTQNDSETVEGSQEAFEKMLHERLRQAVRVALISVLEEEVTAFIGALPYERTQQRRDQRNGHYQRDLETTMGAVCQVLCKLAESGAARDEAGMVSRLNFKLRMTA